MKKRVILTTIFAILFLGLLGKNNLLYAQNNIVDELVDTVQKKQEEKDIPEIEEIKESEKKVVSKYFDIELIRGGQSAFTGNVTYTVKITPYIDSTRTQIQWSYPTALKIIPRHKEFISMRAGETYTVKASIKPERAGVYPITVSAISWQHDTNYTNSADAEVTFNESLVVQPVPQSYIIGNIFKFLIIFLVGGGAIFAAIKLIPKYSAKAKKWLTPPV